MNKDEELQQIINLIQEHNEQLNKIGLLINDAIIPLSRNNIKYIYNPATHKWELKK